MDGQPVARVAHGLIPGEVLPEVGLLLGVAEALGHRLLELGDHLVHGDVELGARRHAVDQAPGESLLRRNLLAQPHDLACAAVAHQER